MATPEPFLTRQKISRLILSLGPSRDPKKLMEFAEQVRACVAHSSGDGRKCAWRPVERPAVLKTAGGTTPWRRVGLVCDAGLGKTTNMEWLYAHLCDHTYRSRIPFLLRLDDGDHLDLLLSTRHKVASEYLLGWMTDRVCTGPGNNAASPTAVRDALHSLRQDGRITISSTA